MPQKVQEYLLNKKILILDNSSTCRQLIDRALTDLGASKNSVSSLKSFEHALEFVRIHKPEIIITDFQVHDRFGLDLVAYQSEYAPNTNQRLFIVVTDNSNDSAVVAAAEEDVDGYILKPFTIDSISDYLARAIDRKLSPSSYSKQIAIAKEFLEAGDLQAARTNFSLALQLHKKPTLAIYYLGEVCRQLKDLDAAIDYFRQGQSLTPLHFRCIVGEFLALFESEKYAEAYELLQKINKIYPLSPKVLKNAFSLCILTYKFDDVEKYYQLYLQLERKTEDLKEVVSKALYKAGSALLSNSKVDDALDYFLKGTVINGKTASYIHGIIDAFHANHYYKEAEYYVGMFEIEEIGSTLYKQLLFKINSIKLSQDSVIAEGKTLINEGIASPEIYIKVFDLLKSINNRTLLESLVYKAIDQYPGKKAFFSPYLS